MKSRYFKKMLEKWKNPLYLIENILRIQNLVIRIEIQPMGLEMEQELHINFKN